MKDSFHRTGFTIVDLWLTDRECQEIKDDILNAPEECRAQRAHELDHNPRVFNLWKHSRAVRDLAHHPKVLDTLAKLWGREPFPFQTLNFQYGTQQPFHQDSIHFDTEPSGLVAGVWVALEDIQPNAGPLVLCQGSHKQGLIRFEDIGLSAPKPKLHHGAYELYETAIAGLVADEDYGEFRATLKQGDAVIWHGHLIHGGSEHRDALITRYSQATHYFFKGADRYYCPMFGTDKPLDELP